MADKYTDILIVGGGLTGAALSQALKASGYRCLLLEANSFQQNISLDLNTRSLALSPASVNILKQLAFWPEIEPLATPIHRIHVSQQKQFGRTTIDSDGALGYLIEMPLLSELIYRWLPQDQVLTQTQFLSYDAASQTAICLHQEQKIKIQTQVIIAADGINSSVRKIANCPQTNRDYGQTAIITNIQLQRSHQYQAFERFTHTGPLAMLPLSHQRCALVWAAEHHQAKKLAQLDEPAFLTALQKAFGYRLGRFKACGKRVTYPLRQVITQQTAKPPFILVGNAAQTLHPVAGQGFNLALRDVATLAQMISTYGLTDQMFNQYQYHRQSDRQAIVRFTNGLIDLFCRTTPGLGALRGLGLLVFDNSPFLKQQLSHYARGFAGFTPDMACGITIKQGVVNV